MKAVQSAGKQFSNGWAGNCYTQDGALLKLFELEISYKNKFLLVYKCI